MKIEDIKYICTTIGSLAGIPIRIYKNNKKVFFYSVVNIPQDPIIPYENKIIKLTDHISYFITPRFHYYGIVNSNQYKIVLGPSRQWKPNKNDLTELAFKCDVSKDDTENFVIAMENLVSMPLNSILQTMCSMNFVLNKEKLSLSDIIIYDEEQLKILDEIKKRLIKKENQGEIKRIYPQKEKEINMPYKESKMEVSMPAFMVGYKDVQGEEYNPRIAVKKHIAIEILLNMIIGKSSNLYKELYEKGIILSEPGLDYEFTDQYAHILISGQSNNPQEIQKRIKETVKTFRENGLNEQHFDRIRKKVYGDYAIEYNSVGNIARMFLADNMKGINSFDYIDDYKAVTKQYVEEILKDIFKEENMVLSIVK